LTIGLVVARCISTEHVQHAVVNAPEIGSEVVGYRVTGVQHVPAAPRRGTRTAKRVRHPGVERERIVACPIISAACMTDPRACF
jgi:hypothetical protein